MRITIEGNITPYYVQCLCMSFFPGSKFSDREEISEETPHLHVSLREEPDEETACASAVFDGRHAEKTFRRVCDAESRDKAKKYVVGMAVNAVWQELLDFAPSWGILTGVRPSKLAMELLHEGKSSDEVRQTLTREYGIIPKKAALATEIAGKESSIIRALPDNSCSIYISIPFCPTRCAYCSFVSYSTKRLLSMIPAYVDRLCEDIDRMFETIERHGQRVTTIYIGGGTPSILTPDQLQTLLSRVERNLGPERLASLAEYTIEAGRPDTITAEKLAVAAEHGITRVSINPQTLNERVLEAIGRRHTVDDFFAAYELARHSGIRYINTDLIAGLPGDSFASFSATVDKILRMRPDNLTVHTFAVKKSADILHSGTEIYSRRGGETSMCVDYSQLRAKGAGYFPYYIYRQKNTAGNLENVGFALPGCEGLYNIFIMEEVHSIFAVGAGAVTKLVAHGGKKIERHFMPKYPYEYLDMTDADITRFFGGLDRFYI